jgi:hypothetical protein
LAVGQRNALISCSESLEKRRLNPLEYHLGENRHTNALACDEHVDDLLLDVLQP